MTQKEIKDEIDRLEQEREDISDGYFAVRNKYSDMAQKEYPYEKYMEEYEEASRKLRALYNKLSDEKGMFDRETFRKRIRRNTEKVEKRAAETGEKKESWLRDNLPNCDGLASELQEKIVQTCIDFFLEKRIDYIDEVSFGVDGLIGSLPYGEWCPCSDSSITLTGLRKDENNNAVREECGHYI